jgi:hypothetical protein
MLRWLWAGIAVPFFGAWAQAAAASCADLLPPPVQPSQRRALSADDLLRLREIGMPDIALPGPSPLAASPDGRQVAFVLRRADPLRNATCHALVVADLSGARAPRVVDQGGELIRIDDVVRGLRSPGGYTAVVTPSWSPDGRALAYLKRMAGRNGIWRASADGSGALPVIATPGDIEDVAWSGDGARLIYAHRPARAAIEAALDREALDGYLYDGRVLPGHGARPTLPGELAREIAALPAAGGASRPATREEILRLGPERLLGVTAPLDGRTPDGRRAMIERATAARYAPRELWAEQRPGRRLRCAADACRGELLSLWWTGDGTGVIFLRREGWAGESTALYRWVPGSGAARRLLVTNDALSGCVAALQELVCLREAARVPLRIVAIDMMSGAERVVFDANPEVAALSLPRVERLRWHSPGSQPTWGDLVIPDGPRPKRGWPLVVVQYRSRGFLRGGIGDEYPIFALAAQGIAVLSFERPALTALSKPDVTSSDRLAAATLRDWDERRSTHAALMGGIGRALARGDIDAARIGLTGLSDGAATTRWALIHETRFRAAAISTCCREQRTDMIYGGIVQADWLRRMGMPPATANGDAHWQPMSLALNAGRIKTPILIQAADDEFIQSLEAYTALREHARPVELHVFPDEHHIKWQPAHRAAIYRRVLDWFGFWLQDRVDPAPAKVAQYERWRALAATHRSASSGGP